MKTPTYLTLSTLVCFFLTSACTNQSPNPQTSTRIMPISEVQWEPLNPARGAQSPQASTLWGDRNGAVPTGFLAKFADGFSSPPHTHNVAYRAIVIHGNIHNAAPSAEKQWMAPACFWTQPKGDVHVTAAQGELNIALVEIDQGPYLVMPPEEAFDSGERAIRIDPSDLEWTGPEGGRPSPLSANIALLWGSLKENSPSGTFLRLPARFEGEIHSHGNPFQAIVIQGKPVYLGALNNPLEPGSYFSSEGFSIHPIVSDSSSPTLLYLRTNAKYTIVTRQR